MSVSISRKTLSSALTDDLLDGMGRPLLIALVAVAAACATLRYGVMESDLLHGLCATGGEDLRCLLRRTAPLLFMQERLGLTALALGSAALLFRSRAVASAAVIAGVAGLILYAADYAVVGLLLGAFVLLARPSPVNRR